MSRNFRFFAVSVLVLSLLLTQIFTNQLSLIPSSKVYAAGNTYYVAKNGSDNNPGTQAQPWLTIQKAAGTLVAGDTVYVESGTYNEQVVPANSGTAGAWITYKAYPGETVTIDGTGLNIGSTGLLYINGKSYIDVEGFQITNSGYGGVVLFGEDHYINLVNLKISHTQWSGINALYNWSIPTPQGHISNIVVDGCEVSYSNYNGEDEGISFRAVSNFEIENSIVHDTQGQNSAVGAQKEGIDAKEGCSNGSIHNNEVYNTKVGLYMDGSGVNIYDNLIHNNAYEGIGMSNEDGDAYNLNIYNNIIYSNNRGIAGYDFSGGKTFTIINNTIYHNASSEIILWNSGYTNSIIRNNIIDGTNDILLNFPSGAGVTVDHNLFYASSYSGSNIYGSNNIQTNPLLVNPTSNFALQSGSPAIDAGSSVDAPSTDYIGTPRPQGNGYDIGAYEYVSSTTSAPSPTPAPTSTPTPTPVPPAVTTDAASSVTSAGAALNGDLTSIGNTNPVDVSFQYGPTTSYGSNTSNQVRTSTGVFDASISGLTPNTIYHFRAEAVGVSTVYGKDFTFTTSAPAPTPTPTPAPTPAPTTATFGLNSGNSIWKQSPGILDVMRFQNTAGTGTLNKLELLFNTSSPSGNVRFGVYADNNGQPGNLLLDAGQAAITNGWVSISGLNLPVTANSYYWLAFTMSAGNGVEYQTGQAAGSHYWLSRTYGALPTTYPTSGLSSNNDPYVMRAAVAVGSTATPAPTPNPTPTPAPTPTPVPTPAPTTATFGLNSGNSIWNQSPDILDVMRFQNTAGAGTLNKLALLFNTSSPSGNVRFGVYADNNGKPGNLLLDAGQAAITNGWVSISGLNLPVTANSYYWLAFTMSAGNGVEYQTGQAAGSHYWVSRTYGALPTTYPTSGLSSNNDPYVMQAAVAVGSTPTPTPSPVTATFGLNSGNSIWNQSPDILDVMRFQNTAGTGTLNKLALLFNTSSPSGNVRFGVYADNNGKPGNLLLDAGQAAITNGWVSISGLNLPVTANSYYWLAFTMSAGNGVEYQTGQAAGSHYWASRTYGALPTTYPTSGLSSNPCPYVMRAAVTMP